MMPGGRPTDRLAEVLEQELITEPVRRDSLNRLKQLQGDTRALAFGLCDYQDKGTAFLLIIDQFEELFTVSDDKQRKQLDAYHVHFNPRTALPDALLASIDIDTPVFDKTGIPLLDGSSWRRFADLLAANTTALAEKQGTPLEIQPGEAKQMTFNIVLQDEPFVWLAGTKII
jgi:hypothetical protein